MIIPAAIKVFIHSKASLGVASFVFTTIAVTEAFAGQMAISVVVALIGAAPPTVAIIMLSKRQSEERKVAQDALLRGQAKMHEELDGKLEKLSHAEKGQARAEGIIEGGDKEQARAAAAPVVAPVIPVAITKVEVVQPPGKSVPVKPDKE